MCWQDEKIRRLTDCRRFQSGTLTGVPTVIAMPDNDRRIAIFVTNGHDVSIAVDGVTVWQNNRERAAYWNGIAEVQVALPRGTAEINIDQMGRSLQLPITATVTGPNGAAYSLWERLYAGPENP